MMSPGPAIRSPLPNGQRVSPVLDGLGLSVLIETALGALSS